MLQREGDHIASSLEFRRNWIDREDRDALLEAKDRTISELKEHIDFLRGELKRKDAILSRIVESVGDLLPVRPLKDLDHLQARETRRARGGNQTQDDAEEPQEKPERVALPKGYRVVATASDAWVLVAPRGMRIAGYRGALDLRKVALDAREHSQRG